MRRTVYLLPALLFFVLPCLALGSERCPDLPRSNASKRATDLREKIRHHNDLYYRNKPTLSDAEYDALFAELVLLEDCFPPLAAAESPTNKIGSDSGSKSLTLRHDRPMLSLSSSTGPEAVEALLQRARSGEDLPGLLVQPKIDGLPVELIYAAGRLVSAATRGDGRFGEDVTSRVQNIPGIPQLLSGAFPARVTVRGEVYADLELMAAAINGGCGPYATSRHFAAGTLRSKRPNPLALAALRLFPFELVHPEADLGLTSDLAALARLAAWGFPVRLDLTWQAATLDQVRAVYQECLAKRGQQPFAADGIVVKLDEFSLRRRLGEGTRAPFWAAAWKFPPATAATVVREIRWQVGRTGRRTPIAEIAPVHLEGIRISRVSLHNARTLSRLGVAAGDRVVIALVADVIPQLLKVERKASGETVPAGSSGKPARPALDACLRDGPGCRAQFLARAAHFVSRAGLNIPGLGRGRLQMLVEAGLVPDLPSLFRLKPEQLAALAGFGARSARRVTAALATVGRPQQFRLVLALGVAGVGPAAADRLTKQYGSLDALLEAGEGDRSGDAAVQNIRGFFATQEGAELRRSFRDLGLL